MNWQDYFLDLVRVAKTKSKDPSTKVGAVIANEKNQFVSAGYNGFPQKIPDTPEVLSNRNLKRKITIHAEKNAILFAQRALDNCTIYTTHYPCSQCASFIIQSGITRVVINEEPGTALSEDWDEDKEISSWLFQVAGIAVIRLTDE